MRLRLIGLFMVLASIGVGASGCLAIAVGAGAAGTVAYMRGDLETQEPYGIDDTYVATKAAFEELGLKIIEGETGKDALVARLTSRDSRDKKIEVRLKAITSNATDLSIRVGTFGDDTETHRIYSAITAHLKKASAGPSMQPTLATELSLTSDSPPPAGE